MKNIGHFLLRRVLQGFLVLFVIATFNFTLVHQAPGDAAEVLAGQGGGADPEYVNAVRRSFGLDQPLLVQYGKYVWNLVQLDLGYSSQYQQSVSEVIVQRLWPTVLLLMASLFIAVSIGITLGIISAIRAGTGVDKVISIGTLLGYSIPVFWLGLMLIVLFSVKLSILPSGGMYTVGASHTALDSALDIARHLVLPATSLAVLHTATYARLMRAQMLLVSTQDFVRTARAKGLSESRIIYRHVLRNAMLPIITFFGLQAGAALGGAVVIEVVFAWPGLGRLAFDALTQRDLNLLLGQLFFCSVLVVVMNLMVDLIYVAVDPRIELQG